MQANEVTATTEPELNQRATRVASWIHLTGFFLIAAAIVVLGILAQSASARSDAGASGNQLGQHSQAIRVYLIAILIDWGLLGYCWAGVHHRGFNLRTLSGGGWTSWKSVTTDLAVALPFWVLWEGAAYTVHRLFGPSSAKSVDNLLPQSLAEILIWIATSISAGVCEEVVFRGYVQRQFNALTGSMGLAVLAQGVVFGLFHSYQGWKNVIVISILGVLYGVLAAWQKNLRVNIIVHSWTDVWSGWLKFVVSR
jgi:uncharacterized protein